MKKLLLFAFTSLFTTFTFAQETEIYNPSFKYDSGFGFTKKHIEIGAAESDLWKRGTSGLPTESELGYTPKENRTMLTCKGYGSAEYGITDTYAVIDAVDLSAHASKKEIKVTFYTKAQYGLGNFSKLSVVATDNYTGDPTTTSWTDVTSQLDQIDDDVNYDSNWTKSTLILNDWKNSTAFVLAFRYQVTTAGKVDTEKDVTPEVDRPGLWRVCEVRFTSSDTPTAIDDISIDKAKLVFPNPATDKIQVAPEVVKVDLYNVNGSHLKQQFITTHTMDIAEYPAGIYILKLTLENGTVITNKLLKR